MLTRASASTSRCPTTLRPWCPSPRRVRIGHTALPATAAPSSSVSRTVARSGRSAPDRPTSSRSDSRASGHGVGGRRPTRCSTGPPARNGTGGHRPPGSSSWAGMRGRSVPGSTALTTERIRKPCEVDRNGRGRPSSQRAEARHGGTTRFPEPAAPPFAREIEPAPRACVNAGAPGLNEPRRRGPYVGSSRTRQALHADRLPEDEAPRADGGHGSGRACTAVGSPRARGGPVADVASESRLAELRSGPFERRRQGGRDHARAWWRDERREPAR